MQIEPIIDALERHPVIAAVTDGAGAKAACATEAEVLFFLHLNLLTAKEEITAAKQAGRFVFVHFDLADGICKDKVGMEWLAGLQIDGIISTRSHIIKTASELGLLTVQRFFALDSKGVLSIRETMDSTRPDLIEIMPGVIPKVIGDFSYSGIPVIAGGLIETKAEITAALGAGALAVSTGKRELWSL